MPKNHYLFSLEDDHAGVKVGIIWFAVRDKASHPSAFIYDFVIYEEFRRRGYGRQTLTGLEEKAKELGLDTISLHVFGHNQAAIALYHWSQVRAPMSLSSRTAPVEMVDVSVHV
jgi:ribosomal protein S18 acetylase RimI-like enzyme